MPDAPHDAVEAAAQAAQAHEFILELPHGYDTVVGERGITLSGGQRQRIAIARALLIDPRILILDDATASVDATTEAQILPDCARSHATGTTIIIAHRLSTIALADEVIVLDDGRIAARGTQTELLDERPSFTKSTSTGSSSRWWPDEGLAVGHPPERRRGARVDDWSWRQTRRRLRVLVRLAKPYKARSSLAVVTLVAYTAVALLRPTSRRSQSTTGSTPETSATLTFVVVAFVVAGIAAFVLSSAQTYYTGWVGERALADLRIQLFRHLQRLSLGYYERNRTGATVSRITNDIEALDQLVTDGVSSLVQASPSSRHRGRAASSPTGASRSRPSSFSR